MITNGKGKAFRQRKFSGNYDQQPTKKLCTEEHILLKQRLACKQVEKHVELANEFMEVDRFVSLQHYEPITNYREGTCSAADFEDHCKDLEELEMLKSSGLSNFDIQLYKDYNAGRMDLYKNVEETALQERIVRINGQIKSYRDKIADLLKAERIRRNILLLEKPICLETQLLALSLKYDQPKEKVSHPMDTIKSLEIDLFSHLPESTNFNRLRSKTRKLNNRISKLQCQLESHVSPPNLEINRKSNWDVCNSDEFKPTCIKSDVNRVYTCLPSNYYTVRNGEIIKLNSTNRLPVQISEEKRSIDNIKRMKKFSNYQIGTPTKIIYVRNLPNAIAKNDLKTIFKLFEENITSYKLLTGRLRGRAFITFNDQISCTAAFDKLNGNFVRDEPMIFDYGKMDK